MPNNDMINKAADKAYERHSQDNTGLALNSRMPQPPDIELEEEVELTPKQKAQSAVDSIKAAGVEASKTVEEQVQPMQEYSVQDVVESAAPPVDLFQLYNL